MAVFQMKKMRAIQRKKGNKSKNDSRCWDFVSVLFGFFRGGGGGEVRGMAYDSSFENFRPIIFPATGHIFHKNQFLAEIQGQPALFSTSYMVGREDKRTNNRTMLPALKTQCS